jgi:hypothetical protein
LIVCNPPAANPIGTMNDVVSFIFNALLHVLLLGAMVAFAVILVRTALSPEDKRERFFRFLALFLGAMIVLGAQATGVSFAVFAAGSISQVQGVPIGNAIASGILPTLAGVALGLYMIFVYQRNDNRAYRVLCFVSMLALASFLTVYAAAASAEGLFLGAAAIPNLSFTAGLGLVVLFGADSSSATDNSILKRLLGAAQRLRGRSTAATSETTLPATAPVSTER